MDRALVDDNVHLSDMVHLALWFNQSAKWTRSLILKQMWIFYFAVTKVGKEFDAIWHQSKNSPNLNSFSFLYDRSGSFGDLVGPERQMNNIAFNCTL